MNKLNILWTTTNRETISKMIVMYASNAIRNGWWRDVNIIIWGASAELVGKNTEVQHEVIELIKAGVHVQACKACADQFGVTERIQKLGVEVLYMGEPLTNALKNNEKILTL